MKTDVIIFVLAAAMLFSGCVSNNEPKACTMEAKVCPDGSAVGRDPLNNCEFTPCPEGRVGGDRDVHGCIGSAGYTWCDIKQKCIRPWEENCTQPDATTTTEPLIGGDHDAHGCIGSAGYTWCETKGKCLRAWEENCTKECGTCPVYSPPRPGWCENGTVVAGSLDECGCRGPPKCVKNTSQTGMANPASTYCVGMGGTLKIIDGSDGQYGVCTLQDGSQCEEWAYIRGECANSTSYVSLDPEQCKVIRFMCVRGKEPFTDEKGCGCRDISESGVNSFVECEAAGYTLLRSDPTQCQTPSGRIFTEMEKTYCTPKQRLAQACTMEYNPVCGWFNQTIRCFAYPCAATYGNPCTACADDKVSYWTAGECPKTGSKP